jgi:hypothetical protein
VSAVRDRDDDGKAGLAHAIDDVLAILRPQILSAYRTLIAPRLDGGR